MKKRPFLKYASVIVSELIASAVILWLVTANRSGIVINYGVSMYRRLRIISLAALIAILVVTVVAIIVCDRRRLEDAMCREVIENEKKAKAQAEENDKAYLSVDEKIEPRELKEAIGNILPLANLPEITYQLNAIKTQLDKMAKYRTRLDTLVESNGAKGLEDSKSILSQMEQYLCRNVRKILNLVTVLDFTNADDMTMLKGRLETAVKDNDEKLKQVKNFIVTTAEFLNKQGDNQKELEMMEIYKNTMIEIIEEEK